MGKFIFVFSLLGFLYLSDVVAQPPGMDFGTFLMMRERAMAMRRAFPFGFPGGTIPPALAARLAAASGGGMFDPSFEIGPGLVSAPFSPTAASLVGLGLPLGPMDPPFIGPSTLDPSFSLRDPGEMQGDSGLAAAFGVDTSTFGGAGTRIPTDPFSDGSAPGPSGFGPSPFGVTSGGSGGTDGFGGMSFSGPPAEPGRRFPPPTMRGIPRRPGQIGPRPPVRLRPPRRLPPRRSSIDSRRRRPVLFSRNIPRPDFPQIPQIPQIPAATGTASSTSGGPGSMTNTGSSTSMNAQSFPTIPSSSGSFNGRTSEFSTDTSPNAIFPSQTADVPVVVSQRIPTPPRFGSTGSPRQRQDTEIIVQFPEEPMIPQIPQIPSRSTPSRRAPNGMLQFGNQGLNVQFPRLPSSMSGGRAQQVLTRSIGMRGIDFSRMASPFRGQPIQPGPAAGPAFVTGADTSQNINIQFRPLPVNQHGQTSVFDPSVLQTGFVAPSLQTGSSQGSVRMGGSGSVSQGSTFTISREASSSGPTEFQIMKVGNIPEFSGGNTVDVKMRGGQAIINGQSSSSSLDATTADAGASGLQNSFQPTGDFTKTNTAFDAIPDLAGAAKDLTASLSSDIALSDLGVETSVGTSPDSSSTLSLATDQASTNTGVETLKLKSPLLPTDFSFFAESTNIETVGQPKEVIIDAAVIEAPTVRTEVPKKEVNQAADFKYEEQRKRDFEMLKQVFITPEGLAEVLAGTSTLEFPVQGKAAVATGETSRKDFSFSQTGETVLSSQTETSSNIENSGASNKFSFFRPPAINSPKAVADKQAPIVDGVHILPESPGKSDTVITPDVAPAV